MATGTTLQELRAGVRAEAFQSLNPLLGRNTDAGYDELLRRMQRQLWLEFAWPHLRVDRDIIMQAGERYYDFPTDLDLDRIESVNIRWTNRWVPVRHGITVQNYNAYDSDAGVRMDPVLAWNPHEGGQFEVWPIPATNGPTIRFRGIKQLGPLVDDGDVCDLDRDLLVLFTAAEVLGEGKSPRAQSMAQRARQHYAKLRQRSDANDATMFVLGGEPCHDRDFRRRRPPLVAVDRGH